MKKSELRKIIKEELRAIREEKSEAELVASAKKFKKELTGLKREARKSPKNQSLEARVLAKEEQLRRVANAIRTARAAKHESIEKIEEEGEYQKFFKTVLDKFDVKSPNELDDAKKKEFFNFIDANWKAKKETD